MNYVLLQERCPEECPLLGDYPLSFIEGFTILLLEWCLAGCHLVANWRQGPLLEVPLYCYQYSCSHKWSAPRNKLRRTSHTNTHIQIAQECSARSQRGWCQMLSLSYTYSQLSLQCDLCCWVMITKQKFYKTPP